MGLNRGGVHTQGHQCRGSWGGGGAHGPADTEGTSGVGGGGA